MSLQATDYLDAPDTLEDDARAEWDRLVPLIAATGRLTPSDRHALEILAGLVCDIRVLRGEVRSKGLTTTGKDGQIVRNPAAVMLNQYRDAALKYLKAFRLVPVSRREQPEPLDDGFAEILWGDTE